MTADAEETASTFKGFTFQRGCRISVRASVQFIPGQVRRVVRLALRGPTYQFARECVMDYASRLKEEATTGQLKIPPEQRLEIAAAILAIANGEDVQKLLGVARPTGGQVKHERHMLIAIDYWLRRSVTPSDSKTYAKVAVDWSESSESTVRGITRRWHEAVSPIVSKWSNSGDGALYLEAVAAARHVLLTGDELPILKHPDETIQVEMDFSLMLHNPLSAAQFSATRCD